MRKLITFQNVLLLILTIMVTWLFFDVTNTSYDGSVLITNQEKGFALIKTDYGGFPVSIAETKKIDDGTKLTLTVINPFVIHFSQAIISVDVYGTTDSVEMNLTPGLNKAEFKVPFIERGEYVEVSLEVRELFTK